MLNTKWKMDEQQGKGFFLSTSGWGWGVFIIKVKIMFKDGDVREFRHQLRFSLNGNT